MKELFEQQLIGQKALFTARYTPDIEFDEVCQLFGCKHPDVFYITFTAQMAENKRAAYVFRKLYYAELKERAEAPRGFRG